MRRVLVIVHSLSANDVEIEALLCSLNLERRSNIVCLLFQAELVAVEGKEIETHYVLARERIRKWNSTSKCYLLVENLPLPLQVRVNFK